MRHRKEAPVFEPPQVAPWQPRLALDVSFFDCKYTHTHTHLHTYIKIHTYTHKHTYTYTHTIARRQLGRFLYEFETGAAAQILAQGRALAAWWPCLLPLV